MNTTETDLDRFVRLQKSVRIVFGSSPYRHILAERISLIKYEYANIRLETRLPGQGFIYIPVDRCRDYLVRIAASAWAGVALLEMDNDLDDDGFQRVMDEARSLFEAKNADYGDSYKSHGSAGVVVRLADKVKRADRLHGTFVHEVKTESLRDTLMDLGNYALMAIIANELERQRQ